MTFWVDILKRVMMMKPLRIVFVVLCVYMFFYVLLTVPWRTFNRGMTLKRPHKIHVGTPTTPAQPYLPTRLVQIIKTRIIQKIIYRDRPTEIAKKTQENRIHQYVQLIGFDVATGTLACSEHEDCTNSVRLRSAEQAKLLCDFYKDKCQGFVFTASHVVLFKSNITGKIVPLATHDLYIKEEHARGLEIPLEVCAVPVDETILSDFTDGCKLAEFNPFDESIMQFIKKPDALQCHGEPKTKYTKGVIEFLPAVNKDVNITSALVYPITRISEKDWGFNVGQNVSLDLSIDRSPVHHEFIRVETKTSDGVNHVEFHANVVPKPDVVARPKSTTGLPLNVMMIGFDSLSRSQFQRAFSETYKNLMDDVNSVIMKGYGVIGDGTTPALTAFLTGHFEGDLPEARRGYAGAAPVDRWPWIFNDYKASGYATMFSEDTPIYGAFNYRLHGFKHPPTDHFSRYFWESAKLTQPYCIHSRPQHLIHFDYLQSFLGSYPDTKKFGVALLTEIGHNNLNSIYMCAEDLQKLLKNQENNLNETLLILYGDHGFRYGESRATVQGHLEERLPLLSFTFPPWFTKAYPEILQNLRHNTDLVTSPFDLHSTLRHILTYPDLPKTTNQTSRGSSLFAKISRSRDCAAAGVAEHYCPCLTLKTADTTHKHINMSAKALVDHINAMLSSDQISARLCHQLSVKQIISSHQQMPNTKFQNFLGPADVHGRIPKFTKRKIPAKDCSYQIQIRSSPGDGLFEAHVRFNNGSFSVTSDISRINKYGEQPRCILDARPDLRKYCLCKDYKPATVVGDIKQSKYRR